MRDLTGIALVIADGAVHCAGPGRQGKSAPAGEAPGTLANPKPMAST